jgi:serine/threonine protein kinase
MGRFKYFHLLLKALLPEFKPTFPKWKKTNKLNNNFPMLGEDGLDLLARMLTYDPNKRITAQMAVKHSYFNDLKE